MATAIQPAPNLAPMPLVAALMTARSGRTGDFRKSILELIAAMDAIVALPLDAEIADSDEWESVLEGMRATVLLLEGATGHWILAEITRKLPTLVIRYTQAERAMLARWRTLGEEIEDKIDATAADEALEEQGDEPPESLGAVRARLGH